MLFHITSPPDKGDLGGWLCIGSIQVILKSTINKRLPNFAVAYEHLGLAYLMTGDYEQASSQLYYANKCSAKRLRINR